MIIVLYTFGISAYFLFEKNYLRFSLGSDVVSYFFVTTYNLMVPGPVLNIESQGEFEERFAFDILYYGLLNVILMNIIFGIIIDTFGALRDETQGRVWVQYQAGHASISINNSSCNGSWPD